MADLLGEENGKRKTMVLLNQYKKQGFEPTSSTLTVMSRSISNLKDLQFWQKTLRVDIETEVFAHLIRNARTPFHALAAYRNALQYTPPTLTLLHPLIKYLQNTNHGKPSKETIDTALRMHATYVTSRNESGAGLDLEQPRKTSELVTYNILLRMLSSSSLADTYTSQTLDLVQEIRNRGLQMSGPVTASLIITLMKSSTKLQDAFQFYRIAYKDREGRLLLESSENFAHVIKAFTDLPFANGLASVAYHFDFIQDIRDAKLPLTAEIYTILLKYYARSAIGLPENDSSTRQKLATVIRRLHDMITVDASLVPDIAMWNQLMDSYQRVGYFQDAIQLWKTMFIARKFDHASVSVVTDACAFAGAHQVAVDIYKQLHEAQFRLNRRNWINWLECLCRLGKFDEALKFVCLQMGKDEHSVAPDADVVKLMLKFAIQENRVGEARTKLKTYLPDVWNSLPKDIKNF
ncbi:hypothetical protein QCA50_002472 [Cerrena zonata]|uniref:Pentatricopeptide repeat-containing protein n=1 Tax=Cerrena zonata TaxID=2478898 RepID=A0AAW0GTH8_9APHY